MRTRDERPANGGGHPEDPGGVSGPMRGSHATRSVGAHSTGTQRVGAQRPTDQPPASYDPYADDDGYSEDDPNSLLRDQDEEFYADPADRTDATRWTAGADLGLLVLRLGIGALFVLHGAQKLFGAFGGPGQGGFAAALNAMGFQQAAVLSPVTGVTEVLAGVLLVFGLFTPLAAAGVLGVLIPAVVTNLDSGFFAPGGVEFPVLVGVSVLGVLFAGPGRVAADNGRLWFRRPLLFGTLGVLVAVAASGAVLGLLYQGG